MRRRIFGTIVEPTRHPGDCVELRQSTDDGFRIAGELDRLDVTHRLLPLFPARAHSQHRDHEAEPEQGGDEPPLTSDGSCERSGGDPDANQQTGSGAKTTEVRRAVVVEVRELVRRDREYLVTIETLEKCLGE